MTPENSWKAVYRLLLWIDPTNGLVHAYESDKCQPGKHWHQRAVRVTQAVADALGVAVRDLRPTIDVLFRESMLDLTSRSGADLGAVEQLEVEDPSGLVAVVEQFLSPDQRPLAIRIAEAARKHLSIENKRKNVLGEGFEDVLSILITRVAGLPKDRMRLRARLSDLPGYRAPASRRKEKRPDVAIVESGRTRMLVSSKWSVRADREDQFADEYQFYRDHQEQARPPETVLITNEFDRARLVSAIESPRFRFDRVVHIQPELLHAAYEKDLGDLAPIMRQKKLISLAEFLGELGSVA